MREEPENQKKKNRGLKIEKKTGLMFYATKYIKKLSFFIKRGKKSPDQLKLN